MSAACVRSEGDCRIRVSGVNRNATGPELDSLIDSSKLNRSTSLCTELLQLQLEPPSAIRWKNSKD